MLVWGGCLWVHVCACLCAQNSFYGQDFVLYKYFNYYLTQGYRATKCQLWSSCTCNVVCWTPVHIDGIKITDEKTPLAWKIATTKAISGIFSALGALFTKQIVKTFSCVPRNGMAVIVWDLVLTQMLMHVIAQGDCADTTRLRVCTGSWPFRKSLATPGNQAHIRNVPSFLVWHSTNQATLTPTPSGSLSYHITCFRETKKRKMLQLQRRNLRLAACRAWVFFA